MECCGCHGGPWSMVAGIEVATVSFNFFFSVPKFLFFFVWMPKFKFFQFQIFSFLWQSFYSFFLLDAKVSNFFFLLGCQSFNFFYFFPCNSSLFLLSFHIFVQLALWFDERVSCEGFLRISHISSSNSSLFFLLWDIFEGFALCYLCPFKVFAIF